MATNKTAFEGYPPTNKPKETAKDKKIQELLQSIKTLQDSLTMERSAYDALYLDYEKLKAELDKKAYKKLIGFVEGVANHKLTTFDELQEYLEDSIEEIKDVLPKAKKKGSPIPDWNVNAVDAPPTVAFGDRHANTFLDIGFEANEQQQQAQERDQNEPVREINFI